jgi:amino acid transporter
MKHTYLAIFTTIAALCFIAMLAVTVIWMYVPTRIVYQESSPVRTESYSVEVKEHGHSYFLTPKQKQVVDLIRSYTPIIWFSCFGYLFLFTAFGGFERLRLLGRRTPVTGGSP